MNNLQAPEYEYDKTEADAFEESLKDAHHSLMEAINILHRNRADTFSEPILATLIELAKVDNVGAWHRLVKKTIKDAPTTG